MRTDDLKNHCQIYIKDGRLQNKNPFKFSELKWSTLATTDISCN